MIHFRSKTRLSASSAVLSLALGILFWRLAKLLLEVAPKRRRVRIAYGEGYFRNRHLPLD